MIRVFLLQCHYAEVSGGRLFMSGAGWTTRKGPGPWAVAVKIEADRDEAPETDTLRISCLTREGEPVGYAEGGDPIRIEFGFDRSTIPPHRRAEILGAIVLSPKALRTGEYLWRVTWGDIHRDDWDFEFTAIEQPAAESFEAEKALG
jgi:hypothetical protein